MAYERVKDIPKTVYHYTKKSNLDSILKDGKIKRFRDAECWFCTSLEDVHRYMELTVMNEGQAYYDVNGILQRYPEFVAEDYVVLALEVRYQNGDWVKWNQEYPPDTPKDRQALLQEFSDLKTGYRGDLKFKQNPQIIDVSEWLQDMEQEQTIQQTQSPQLG